jgi:hypothetical protein
MRVNRKVKAICELREYQKRQQLTDCNWILTGLNMHSTALHCHSGRSGDCVNVDTPLSDYTILEQRAIIRFLWTQGVKPIDIYQRMLAQYSTANCTSLGEVYKWVKTFKSGRTSVSDEAPGSP